MLGKKKDGKLRLFADYQALNEVTKKDRHPLALISQAWDRLGGAKYFTKLDIKDTYHKIRIREGKKWNITFSKKVRKIQVPSHAIGAMQRTGGVPTLDQ